MPQLTSQQKIEILKLATQLSIAQLTTQINEQEDKVINFSGNLDTVFNQMIKLITNTNEIN